MEASSEFGGVEAAIAEEAAKEIGGRRIAFLGVAVEAAGDEVAVGMAAGGGLRDNVVEAADGGSETAQAVEAKAALAGMKGFAEGGVLEEIEFSEAWVARGDGVFAFGGRAGKREFGNFTGKANLHDMAGLGALEEAQSALGSEAADGLAGGLRRDARAASQPGDGEAQLGTAFQTTVTKKVRVNGAIHEGEAKSGDEDVFELLPEQGGVEFFVAHGRVRGKKTQGCASAWDESFAVNLEKRITGKRNGHGEEACGTVRRFARRPGPAKRKNIFCTSEN